MTENHSECANCCSGGNSFISKNSSPCLEDHEGEHSYDHGSEISRRQIAGIVISLVLLGGTLLIDYVQPLWWDTDLLRFVAFFLSILPVGIPVVREGWELFRAECSLFNEYTLMTMASIGAFVINEYPEAVLLMVLYNIGEVLQGLAIRSARKNISDLVDVRTHKVLLVEGEATREVLAEEVVPGEVIRLNAGMRLSLDGVLESAEAVIDMSALTGESVPIEKEKGETLLAGSVIMSRPIDVRVSKPFEDSTLSRILQMAEEAAERKPRTERFIRRFARVYTPIVVGLAVLVVLVPWIVSLVNPAFPYDFSDWFYRALVFLVTSCPCALIISVPMAYFSGIGAASKHGLLFKGALFMEKLKSLNIAVFDKTGTLTEGSFEVQEVRLAEGTSEERAVGLLAAVERQSTHPMAIAITAFADEKGIVDVSVTSIKEVAGMGLTAQSAAGERLLVGSERLMERHNIYVPVHLKPTSDSAVLLAVGEEVIATVILSDVIKKHSSCAIERLHKQGVDRVVMLSGDKQEVVDAVAQELGIDQAFGGLLPDEKMARVEVLMQQGSVAFVGDGLNDAPVMSMTDVGVAMGGIGSDATIESADLVIQGDDPYKLVQAIEISRHTHQIVLQNIIFALGFKFVVMLLATLGYASLTIAIIADVGVTLLTVFNSLRALTFRASEPVAEDRYGAGKA